MKKYLILGFLLLGSLGYGMSMSNVPYVISSGDISNNLPSNVVTNNYYKTLSIGTSNELSQLNIDAGTTTNTYLMNLVASINDFAQINVQNRSNGTGAQSGAAFTADNGTNTTNFMWIGRNNSGYNNPASYNVGVANDGEILNLGGDLAIASDRGIKFYTNGTAEANRAMTVSNNGYVGIGTISPNYKLEVAGTVSANEYGYVTVLTSANVTGIINTTICVIHYYKTGKLINIFWLIVGTNSATAINITGLPKSYNNGQQQAGVFIAKDNGGAMGAAACRIPDNSTTINLFKDCTFAAFTGSGSCEARGSLTYICQ